MSEKVRTAFTTQIAFCRVTGSALTANVLAAVLAAIDDDTRTAARILNWPGDPMIDALKLRIAGGLNALARAGHDHELTALYLARDGDWHSIIARVLREYDDWLYPWLDGPPQTNEVGRSAVLFPGMMEIARRFGPKLEILELGASGGLNLNMDRFGYILGGYQTGAQNSCVQLVPVWAGPPPAVATVDVVARGGVDLQPLNMTDPAVAERMMAYIWPDQDDRVARAAAAIAIAREYPPRVDAGDGAEWVERKLAEPQNSGVTRVIYHSIALQYFPSEGRARVKAAIEAAGASATDERPLAWLSMEFPDKVALAQLRLQCWPGSGAVETLANVHPHGASINWGCAESS